METKQRYVCEEREGYHTYDVVIDSETGRELCDADSCETPEDASVYRHFTPLLDELNVLAEEVRRLRAQLKTQKTSDENPCGCGDSFCHDCRK